MKKINAFGLLEIHKQFKNTLGTYIVARIWTLLPLKKIEVTLEPKQFKNNLTMFESKLILKLPPFLTHCVGEGKRR